MYWRIPRTDGKKLVVDIAHTLWQFCDETSNMYGTCWRDTESMLALVSSIRTLVSLARLLSC